MKLKITFISSTLLLGLLACSSSDSSSSPTPSASASDAGSDAAAEIDAATAKQIASAAVPGTASEPAKLTDGDEVRWVVVVTLANGATVDVEISRLTGALEEIKGESGPFDYEIPAPAPGLLSFSQAKAKALAAKAGTIQEWEVKPPTNLYEFYVRDATGLLWEIKMTANAGDITSTIEKEVAD